MGSHEVHFHCSSEFGSVACTHLLNTVLGLQVQWEISCTLLIYLPYFAYWNRLYALHPRCCHVIRNELHIPLNPVVRNRRTKQTQHSLRSGCHMAPPITDLASALRFLSVVSVYYGSLRLPRPPFWPLSWHAHLRKNLLIGASPGFAANCKRRPFSSTRQPGPMLPVCEETGTKKICFKS
jgi:hypothetical protein